MVTDGYDQAQVCPNGHVANSSMHNMPEDNKAFCDRCGEATINSCPKCQGAIRGTYWGTFPVPYHPPSFCSKCGASFPWTASRLRAALDLAATLDTISPTDRSDLEAAIPDLVKDTPDAQVGAVKFKKIMLKAGEGVATMFRDILTDVLSETAKKVLLP
jgi:hypothetical protein